MKNIYLLPLLFMFVLMSSAQQQSLTYSPDLLKITYPDDYARLYYPGLPNNSLAGHPQLPMQEYLIPKGALIKNIRILHTDSIRLEKPLYPAQKPQALSVDQGRVLWIKPEASVYNSAQVYPPQISAFEGQSHLQIFPFRYLPTKNMLIVHTEIEIEYEYIAYTNIRANQRITERIFAPGSWENVRENRFIQNPEEYIIITSEELSPAFDSLLLWKKQKGLNAKIYSTEQIYSEFQGKDRQDEIRQFVRYQYLEKGTKYVLLAGDTSVVPSRYAWAMDCEYPWGPENQNDIPCDLYYADLDGSWDANQNGIYGEIADEISLIQEVFVGRLPIESAEEARIISNKIISYEKSPPDDFLDNMLFLAEVLWDQPYTNSGIGLNFIDSIYVPDFFKPIEKLYEADGNENEASVTAALQNGKHIINHNGHAWFDVMSAGDYKIRPEFVAHLQNQPKNSFIYSIGCWPAAFDYECIAEDWLSSTQGGAFAFIGNSRYGWGSPGNPEYGYSDLFNQAFYEELFTNGYSKAGEALALAKAQFIAYAQQENVYRWCLYEVNLLGDPEMALWTYAPESFIVQGIPDSLIIGDNILNISILSNEKTLKNARISLMQDEFAYAAAKIESSGQAVLPIHLLNSAHDVLLSITADGFLPYQISIPVAQNKPWPSLAAYNTQKGAHVLACDDNTRISLLLKSSMAVEDLSISLRTDNENIELLDSTESIEVLHDSIVLNDALAFKMIESLPNYGTVGLRLHFKWKNGEEYDIPIRFRQIEPDIRFAGYYLADSSAYFEAGTSRSVGFIISNSSAAQAENLIIQFNDSSGRLQFSPEEFWLENMPPNSADTLFCALTALDGTSPAFPEVAVEISHQCGMQEKTNFKVVLGETGFFDDMENGDSFWTHWGWRDHWHISTNRAYSGTHSWYVGYSDSLHYEKGMLSRLKTKTFIAGTNPQLSFYAWYLLPTYGTNGISVETSKDGIAWTKHDYFGSGGALGILTTGNNWLPYVYDLSPFYEPGDSISVRFSFISSWEKPTEGVYIDDVRVGAPKIMIETDIEDLGKEAFRAVVLENPISDRSILSVHSEKEQHLLVDVVNMEGAVVDRVYSDIISQGPSNIPLARLQKLNTGIYLLRIQSQQHQLFIKLIRP